MLAEKRRDDAWLCCVLGVVDDDNDGKVDNSLRCVPIVGGRFPLTILAGEVEGEKPLDDFRMQLPIASINMITFRTARKKDAILTTNGWTASSGQGKMQPETHNKKSRKGLHTETELGAEGSVAL